MLGFLILLALDIGIGGAMAKGSGRLIPIKLDSSHRAAATLSGGQTGV
jgi:hypothetical protein